MILNFKFFTFKEIFFNYLVATCPIIIPENLTNPATPINPNVIEIEYFRSGVNPPPEALFVCNVPGESSVKIRKKRCLFHYESKTYVLQGDDLECNCNKIHTYIYNRHIINSYFSLLPSFIQYTIVIDCGNPAVLINGLDDSIKLPNFTYGMEFQFKCKNGFNVLGGSENTVVKCEANGLWNFGKIRCIRMYQFLYKQYKKT